MIDLTEPRLIAETTLQDVATVTRASTGPGVLNYTDGSIARPPDVAVGTWPCSVNAQATNSGNLSDVGADDRVLNQYVARLPLRATGIAPGDLFTVTTVHSGGDPALLGRTFTVQRAEVRTNTVLRHLLMVETLEADGIPT